MIYKIDQNILDTHIKLIVSDLNIIFMSLELINTLCWTGSNLCSIGFLPSHEDPTGNFVLMPEE